MKKTVSELSEIAGKVRRDILDLTYHAGVNGGHLGGALSSVEILSVLYGYAMNLEGNCSDTFLLSKGHISIAHYSILYEMGYLTEEELKSFEKNGSQFPTHEEINPGKGITASSGSLGYGLSLGVGIALADRLHGNSSRTYVLLGDGECNEGTVWEAVMAAARFHLGNLTAIIDVNGQSMDGYTDDIMPVQDIEKTFSGLGWNFHKVNGNSIEELCNCFSSLAQEEIPNVIVAKTIKGKGIPSIENRVGWHHAILDEETYNQFRSEMEKIGNV